MIDQSPILWSRVGYTDAGAAAAIHARCLA